MRPVTFSMKNLQPWNVDTDFGVGIKKRHRANEQNAMPDLRVGKIRRSGQRQVKPHETKTHSYSPRLVVCPANKGGDKPCSSLNGVTMRCKVCVGLPPKSDELQYHSPRSSRIPVRERASPTIRANETLSIVGDCVNKRLYTVVMGLSYAP